MPYLRSVTKDEKQMWFEQGAASYARLGLGMSTEPVYPCPICLKLFPREALDNERLSAEDVRPKSNGGRPLLMTSC